MSFTQTSSIVRRFRVLTIFLGLFLLLEFLGIFVSSQTFLNGLRELNQINTLTSYATRGLTNLTSARDALEKGQSEAIYKTAATEVADAIQDALDAQPKSPEVLKEFSEASKSLVELNRTANDMFALRTNPTQSHNAKIAADLLLTKQFELDIIDSLRAVQIELTRNGNDIFSSVYQSRLTPLIVSFGLAILFFVVAMFTGLYTTRRLSESLQQLLHATDEVARGNLNVKVRPIDQDEIGRLSYAFDEMVKNLDFSLRKEKSAAERVSRLQDITAEFSRALDPEGVGNAIILHGKAELGANGGYVGTFSNDRAFLELVSASGYSESTMESWETVSHHY